MNRKREQILISLIIVFLLIITYLIITSKTVQKVNQSNSATNNITTAQMEEKYQTQVKKISNYYEKLISTNDYTIDQITQTKNKLLNLQVPTKFKDLHINLVLALTRMENYLTNKDEAEKIIAQQLINQVKIDYSWIAN
ncbi:MAG: hypothetical protein ABIJ83_04475 [Patescibacteria group bacterium]|nr:hypothetical protein [Patescibacteria group bacterium]MBU0897730.1 hypothetical protein [Patescibacteria group bacterium]MBU1063166.1 hypothetical protein [Patescibacteria group bacterium]MBU1783043.1 hypothetical protein [Patescibacteria group bacterium]MBU2214308.1 hypothetical protein [Patescibacteria group bacterium]